MDETRNQLKTMNRQFSFYMKHKTAMKNNLLVSWIKLTQVLILLTALLVMMAAKNGLILLLHTGMWTVSL